MSKMFVECPEQESGRTKRHSLESMMRKSSIEVRKRFLKCLIASTKSNIEADKQRKRIRRMCLQKTN